MKSINEYIRMINSANDTGSEKTTYAIDDIVLIRYSKSSRYGIPRPREEHVLAFMNKKNAQGVRIPKVLDIKRETTAGENICWVLQQRASGVNFGVYCQNKDHKVQLQKQKILADAPQQHYNRFVKDLCELLPLGLELNPKNIFYDEDVINGGFSIVGVTGEEDYYFRDTLKDVLRIKGLANVVSYFTAISAYDNTATEQDKALSQKQRNEIKKKIFVALSNVISNFNKYHRWVLRTYNSEELEYFANNGIQVGNLTLNKEEKAEFKQMTKNIIYSSVRKLKQGTHQYSEIETSEIKNDLLNWGLCSSWKYHSGCNYKRSKSLSEAEYNRIVEKDLWEKMMEQFDDCAKNPEFSYGSTRNKLGI